MSLHRYDAPAELQGLDIETLRANLAPGATNQELTLFATVCRHLDLDPFGGHIYLIGRRQRVGPNQWAVVHKPQISVAGRRVLAERTGQLEGIQGPEWCSERRRDRGGRKEPLEWDELWDDDDLPPYAARCLVYRTGWKVPSNGTAKWTEFAVWEGTGSDRRLSQFWQRAPSHMLGKVAEALALRRAFPEVQAAVAYVDGGGFEADDQQVIAEAEPVAAGSQEPTPDQSGPRREEPSADDDPGRPF